MSHLRQPNPMNPVVFLDVNIGEEQVGRIVIELRKDVVPIAAENFRALCTGERGITENGVRLHYKGTKFNTVKRLFMVQGGDVVNNDGTSGESIYGPVFSSEKNSLPNEEGAVGLANFGSFDSNNSQFYICTVDCQHLDESNLVIGHVIRGLGVTQEMEKYASDEGLPARHMYVSGCGELQHDEDWEIADNDETEDTLPPFVRDWEGFESHLNVEEMLKLLACIKEAGNFFYKQKRFVEASRKYKKGLRYYHHFKDHVQKEDLKLLQDFHLYNSLNSAVVELKLGNYQDVIYTCNEALKLDADNVKALYRRGQAKSALKLYESALDDLKLGYKLAPDNNAILIEFERIKKLLLDYRQNEKTAFAKLFI